MEPSKDQCAIPGCTKPRVALGLCGTDYTRYRRGKYPDYQPDERRSYTYRVRTRAWGELCGFKKCGRPRIARGYCETHAEQDRRGVELTPIYVPPTDRRCSEKGCERPHEAHGYCDTHYQHAIGRAELAVSANRRATSTTRDGYVRVFVPGHPCAQKSGYALESHVVMTAVLGRPVMRGETVHHKDGNRSNNSPGNLEVWVSRHGKGQRVEDVVAWAKEVLTRYEPAALASGHHVVAEVDNAAA